MIEFPETSEFPARTKWNHRSRVGLSPRTQTLLMGLVVAFCVGEAAPYVWTGGVSIAPTRERLDVRHREPAPADGREYLVDINTASAAELLLLPGVGLSIAENIVAERDANGPFRSFDDLKRVKGLGIKKIQQIQECAVPMVSTEILVERGEEQTPQG